MIFWRNPTLSLAFQKAAHDYDILASTETFAELERNLYKPKFAKYIGDQDIDANLRDIADISHFVEITTAIDECRHRNDNKFLDLALSGGAKLILSGDNDLVSMHPWRGISIVKPHEFLKL